MAAARYTSNLLMYETTIPGGMTERAFHPQLFVDISDTLEAKTDALNRFSSQKTRGGHLWVDAVVGRSGYRGYQISIESAEASEVIEVIKW
jgi:N-acetylglucosamine malate deacetylase 1